MNINDPEILQLLLLSNSALLAAGCIAILRFQKQKHEFEKFWASPAGSSLANTTDDTSAELLQMNLRLERRITALQLAVSEIGKHSVTSPAPVERSLPIENAVRMAKDGATVADLTRACGLNTGEARLLQKLHGRVRAVENGA